MELFCDVAIDPINTQVESTKYQPTMFFVLLLPVVIGSIDFSQSLPDDDGLFTSCYTYLVTEDGACKRNFDDNWESTGIIENCGFMKLGRKVMCRHTDVRAMNFYRNVNRDLPLGVGEICKAADKPHYKYRCKESCDGNIESPKLRCGRGLQCCSTFDDDDAYGLYH